VKLDFVFVGDGTPAAAGSRRGYEDSYTVLRDAEDAAAGATPVPLIQARIPATYLAETRLRIDFYRKLALADGLPQIGRSSRTCATASASSAARSRHSCSSPPSAFGGTKNISSSKPQVTA